MAPVSELKNVIMTIEGTILSNPMIVGAIGLLLIVLIIILVRRKHRPEWYEPFQSPSDIAGIIGEKDARERIRRILCPDDRLFSNVTVSYDDREAELDNVIVNRCGVFIVEVKNYSGTLEGEADDYEWTKSHISQAGNEYTKTVKNPIRQVKRQIYILAKYLEDHGIRTWIEGYVYMCDADSPVEDDHILPSMQALDRIIHTTARSELSQKQIDAISEALC